MSSHFSDIKSKIVSQLINAGAFDLLRLDHIKAIINHINCFGRTSLNTIKRPKRLFVNIAKTNYSTGTKTKSRIMRTLNLLLLW